jgi:hypothetical protein
LGRARRRCLRARRARAEGRRETRATVCGREANSKARVDYRPHRHLYVRTCLFLEPAIHVKRAPCIDLLNHPCTTPLPPLRPYNPPCNPADNPLPSM